MAETEVLVPMERIEQHILLIRGHKVMLDQDLAQLYGVETRAPKQAVRRNKDRFPEDLMFELTWEESEWVRAAREPRHVVSRSQNVIMKRGANVKYKTLRLHRTGRGDAVQRTEQPPRRTGQHPDDAHLRAFTQNARLERGSRAKARGARKEVRRPVQGRVRRHTPTHVPAAAA